MKSLYSLTLIFLAIITGCKTSQTSNLIADLYDPASNVTTLIIIPYGNIDILGKWTKYYYNQSSKQHFFRDQDSTSIAVAKVPIDKYSFYNPEQTSLELVDSWFNWENEYYSQHGIQLLKLNNLTEDGFVVFQAKAEEVNTIFLYGVKNNFAYGLGVFTDNWEKEKRISFLKNLWNEN